MQNGQKVTISNHSYASFSEGASENKKDRFFNCHHLQEWRIFMIGESDNICVIVNNEGLYVSIPIEHISPVKRIYICGPITGVKNDNVESFTKYATKFSQLGYDVVNPQELNHESAEAMKMAGENQEKIHSEYMRTDIAELVKCDIIGLMYEQPWNLSKGCKMELSLALQLGLKIIDVETEKEVKLSFVELINH